MMEEITIPRVISRRKVSLLEMNTDVRALMPDDLQEQVFIHAGWGSCRACRCSGYSRGDRPDVCECGHHFSRHE